MKRRGKKWQKKRLMEVFWFLVKFNLLVIPMYILIYMNISIPPLQSFVANSVHALVGLMGYSSAVDGYMVNFSTGFSLVNAEMTFDCAGWKSLYALFALVVATPRVEWVEKLKFLLVGLPAIFAINIVRIATTIAAVISFGIGYLDMVHSLLWQEGLIIAVVGIWYLWLRKTKLLNISKYNI
jgi:exosortase/archaeosortase family protein